jgi:hypothetical protein
MTTTTITWVRADQRLPDDSTTVLIHVPDCSEPVWFGYYNHARGLWFSIDQENMQGLVQQWADLPAEPTA